MRRHGWESRRRRPEGGSPAPVADETPQAPAVGEASAPEGSASDVEIPELRKKEEEKKGAGAFWLSGGPGQGSLLARAATGGGYVHATPFGLGRLAAGLAQRLGAQSAIGRLLLGRMGGWLLLGGILGGGIMAGLFAAAFAKPRPKLAAAPQFSLEAPKTGVVVAGPRDRSLSYLQNANQGELNFEDARQKPASGAAETEGAAEAETPPEAATLGSVGEPPALPEGVADAVGAAAGSGAEQFAKLADLKGLGKSAGFGGSFGGANSAARGLPGNALPPKDGRFGKSAAFAKGRPKIGATNNMRRIAGRAQRAMGQLKMSRFMSGTAALQSNDASASQYATNAFEQGKTQGGENPAFIGPSNGAPQVVVPPGAGAPDVTSLPTPPEVGPEINATPYQPNLDAAMGMGDMAGMMKMMSILMIIAGIAMIIAGYNMGWTPAGIALVIAGIAMLAAGMMMAASAMNMAAQAEQMAKSNIDSKYDQKDQAKIASDRAKAKAQNQSYTPPDMSQKTKNNAELRQNIKDTRDADYQFDDGTKGNQ
ncbi:MAG: hypothetical protein HY553_00375 [Elusimicrobia bacterium]|nr:hypothetical protein [Elusimicrobiota bacterium]